MADPIGEIPVIITGDDSQLQAAINAAAQMAATGARKIADAFSEAVGGLGNLGSNLYQGLAESGPAFQAFASHVQNFIAQPLTAASEVVGEFLNILGPLGIAAGGAATSFVLMGRAISDVVLEAGKAAESTSNLADRLNLTFDHTKTLSEMAQIAGISLGGLNVASARLADSMEGDSKQAKATAAALNELG